MAAFWQVIKLLQAALEGERNFRVNTVHFPATVFRSRILLEGIGVNRFVIHTLKVLILN